MKIVCAPNPKKMITKYSKNLIKKNVYKIKQKNKIDKILSLKQVVVNIL